MVDISVVCPTYNSADFIDRTLDSVLSQKTLPKEVIIVDDGSSDSTIARLETYRDRFANQKVELKILQQTNQGPGAARNNGISNATSQWIAFLDSDDTWHTDKIHKVLESINTNPKANFVVHWEEHQKIDGTKSLIRNGHGIRQDNISRQIYLKNPISTSAVCVKKDILDMVGGFNTSLPVSQDYDLWLKLAEHMKIEVISEALGTYIDRANNITSRPYYWKLRFILRILYSHRHKVSSLDYCYKLLRTFVCRAWLPS